VARTETYDLRAANAEVDLFEWITVGVSFVETEAILPGIPGPTLLTARIPEVYASFRTGGFEGFAGWSQKRTNVTGSPVRADGGGIYGALSWAGTGVGVTMDYKDYRYDISDPYSRYDPTRPTRMLPVQNPPIVQREHSWTFLTRALHEVNFNDEVGMQLEGFFKVDDATTVTVNASLSSEHDYFLYQMNSFSFVREPRLGNFLPSMDARLSPYWELLVEGEHYSVQRGLIRGAIAMRQYTQSVLFTSGSDHVIRSLVLPALVQVGVDDMNTLTVQGEFEAVSDNYNDSAERYENYLLALSFTMPPGLTLAARAEFTSNPGDLSGRRSWFAGEVGYRLGGAHSIALIAGQERGGKVCTNGVCRSIQPFNGVRLAIQSNM
jgi:hypothetical protein